MHGADRGAQTLGALSFLGVHEVGAQDVGQFHDQLADIDAERLRFAFLRDLPEVTDQAGRRGAVAVDDLAIGLHSCAQPLQAALQRLIIFCDARDGGVPQFRQRAGCAFRHLPADFALDPDRYFPDPIDIALCRDLLETAVDKSRQRLHRVSGEDEREVVAQRGEIAISGEERRLQIAQRGELTLRHPAGEMKRDMRLKFCLHAETALILVSRCPSQALGWALPSAPCGQIVNLSNSASRPDLM